MLQNFQAYQLAVQLHRACRSAVVPAYLREQLLRAASSVALNLAEGSAKPTAKDQRRFYSIALGSLRECQAVLDLSGQDHAEIRGLADRVGGCVYRLCRGS